MNKEKTDQKIAEFLQNLERLEMSEPNKLKLIGQFHTMIDQVLLESNDVDYMLYQSKKRKKNITLATICFVLGLLVAFIPSLMYISSLKNDGTPPLEFVPNVTSYFKPIYVQAVTTQKQADLIKKSSIRDAHLVTIGATVKIGAIGLSVIPAKEMQSPEYHTKYVGVQKDKIKTVNGFQFIPDTLFSVDPLAMELITNTTQLEEAKKMKHLASKDLLEIGAAIACPSHECYVAGKETLKNQYSKITPISA